MNVAILGMNYAPEVTGIGPQTAALAAFLASRGHRVTVLTTFPHYPSWRFSDRWPIWRREHRDGVEVRRGPIFLPWRKSALQRVLYDTSLALSTLANAGGLRRADVVMFVSPPLQLGLVALLLGRLFRAPLVMVIQDIVPDAALAAGIMAPGRLVGLAQRLERLVYRHADAIVAISEGLAENLCRKRVAEERIHVIPNAVDLEHVRPLERLNAFRAQHALGPQDFMVLHAGNMGTKQGLSTVLDAAAMLADDPRVVFFLVGDGIERQQLAQTIAERKLKNVRLLGLQPPDVLPQMLAASDLVLLVQRRGVTDMVAPSKLLTYMAAGRAICASVDQNSEGARVVLTGGCGVVVPAECPTGLAEAIISLVGAESERNEMGQRGRRYVEQHHRQDSIAASFEHLLQNTILGANQGNATG